MTLHRHYDKLTARERFLALLAADARNDDTEYGRLTASAPMKTYRMRDAAVLDLLDATRELALIFTVLWHDALRDYTLGLFAVARHARKFPPGKSRRAKAGEAAWQQWLEQDERYDELQTRGLYRLLGLVRAWDAFCREHGLPGDTILQARVGPVREEVASLRARLLDSLLAEGEGWPEVREVEADCTSLFRSRWPAPAE